MKLLLVRDCCCFSFTKHSFTECGVPSVSSTPAGSYVLYGNDAVPGEWPWQALFFMDGSSGCGATLIDPYYAITAAHCVEWVHVYVV